MKRIEVSTDEAKLLETFRTLDVQPKADTKEDFEDWMLNYVKTKFASSTLKEPQDSKPPTLATATDHDGQQTLRSRPHLPRLSIFSGTSTEEGEATFDLWHYEVKCLQKSQYTEATILEAV
ncbi:hypothetical protein ACOMHN_016735 [Nucella lapillus]